MFYIVALGNPGDAYTHTRHNVGWMALDIALQAWNFPSLVAVSKVSGRVTQGQLHGQAVQVLYPDTYMNNSGAAVQKFVPKDATQNLIVVHDDIDVPFGVIKIVQDKGAGGNNGVESIVAKLDTKQFIRVRIGIAPTSFWTGKPKRPAGGGALERFVLKPFSVKEQTKLPEVLEQVKKALEVIVLEGAPTAMNQFN